MNSIQPTSNEIGLLRTPGPLVRRSGSWRQRGIVAERDRAASDVERVEEAARQL
jgi:hypothetical protein